MHSTVKHLKWKQCFPEHISHPVYFITLAVWMMICLCWAKTQILKVNKLTIRLSPCNHGKRETFPQDWRQAPRVAPLMKCPTRAEFAEAGLPAGRAMDSGKNGRAYAVNLFQAKNPKWSHVYYFVNAVDCLLTSTYFAFGLASYRSLQSSTDKRVGVLCLPGQASFPHLSRSAWPCTHLSNQDWRVLRLQWGWLSETIRLWDSSGSLPLFSMPQSI